MAKKQRHTPEQVISKLREVEIKLAKGTAVALACKDIGVTEQTYYRRRKEYGGLKLDQAKPLAPPAPESPRVPPDHSSGEKAKARDIIAASRTLKAVGRMGDGCHMTLF